MLISSLPGANPLPPEHKIGIFVRFWGLEPPFSSISSTKSRFLCFWGLEPPFSGVSSTKSGFLCSRGGECGIVKRNREDAYHFAAAPTPSHQRTSTPAPAHQHQLTSPATAPQQWYQALSSAVLAPCSAFLAPSSAFWRRVMPSSTVWHRLGTM